MRFLSNHVRIALFFVAVFVSVSTFSFGQDSQITIRYIGNCGLHITDGKTHIYTDFPYKSGAFNYLEYSDSELDSIQNNAYFIFTHNHADHYHRRTYKKATKDKGGNKYGKWNIPELEKLGELIPDFEIKAFRTKHHLSIKHYSYMITWHGKKIYLSGDTESAETIGTMEGIDWAFVPAWLLRESMESKTKIDAKMIAIYHIGQKDNINITGDKIRMLKTPGEIISIPYS